MVRRIYVQKKPGFDVEAKGILEDLKDILMKAIHLIKRIKYLQ